MSVVNPTVIPNNCLGLQIESMELLVAHCPAFVAAAAAADNRFGAADPDNARSHVGIYEYWPALLAGDDYDPQDWPYAIVAPDTPGGRVAVGTGDAIVLLGRGDFVVVLASMVDPSLADKDAFHTFCNFHGKVADEMSELAAQDYEYNSAPGVGTPDRVHPAVTSIELHEPITRTRGDQRVAQDFWGAVYSVSLHTGVES